MTSAEQQHIDEIFELQAKHKYISKQSTTAQRLAKLKAFKELLLSRKAEVAQALAEDFRKPEHESYLNEVLPIISMLNHYIKQLSSWMKPQKISSGALYLGTNIAVEYEAKGNVLVISPWNYPFHLAVYPAITAFAAGNTVIVKPSEFTRATNEKLIEFFASIFDQTEISFIEGEVAQTHHLLSKPFDHIFFTGSTAVGKIVMSKAAEHLASVTLELGGKSPVIIDGDYDLEHAAKRIVWGKFVNSGQTCIAPDYLLVPKDKKDELIKLIIKNIESSYAGAFSENQDYCKVITKRHAARLNQLVVSAKEAGARVEFGGEYDGDRVLSPTILSDVKVDMQVMQEEIFGPVLPILTYENIDECLELIQSHDNPLSLYLFTYAEKLIEKVRLGTNSGGFVVNDTLLHAGHPELPFGGAGKSGIGKYHGRFGFIEFSNARGVLQRNFDTKLSFFYPPYSSKQMKVIEKIFRYVNRLL